MGKVVAIIAARLSSKRLPGKALLDIAGRPMLARVYARTIQSGIFDDVVIATSVFCEDDPIADYCREWGWPRFRGNDEDVLDRLYQASKEYDADAIARITGDCPLLPPAVMCAAMRVFTAGRYQYVSNINPPTWPDGCDVEIMTVEALRLAWREATLQSDREHVTPWLRRNLPRKRQYNVEHKTDLSHHRWCVDTAEDLEFVRRVYTEMGRDDFGMADVLALLDRKPELANINGHLTRNSSYLAQVEGERHE